MKKIVTLVLALVLLFALASTAMAGTASYDGEKITWSTSLSEPLEVKFQGDKIGGKSTGVYYVDLEAGTYTVTFAQPAFAGGKTDSATFTVGGAVAPETTTPAPETTTPAPETTTPAPETTTPAPETTTPAPETTTPAPETTTPAPETTTPAPETTAPVVTDAPTKAPAADNDADDVPKTGDSATFTYVLAGMMLLAGACLVLSRKLCK